MQVIESTASLIFGLAVIALFSRLLRLQYQQWQFANQRRAAIIGIIAVFVSILIVSLLAVMIGSMSPPKNDVEDNNQLNYSLGSVISQGIVLLVAALPILIALRARREPWASAGITGSNLLRTSALGLILVAIQMAYITATGGFQKNLVTGHFWAFLQYAVVGFSEEFMFRGYLQTRICAWLGKYSGWLITSVIMALSHLAHRISFDQMDAWTALAACASLIPVSLLMGFLYLRSGNIVAPGIVHTFANWVNTL